MSRFEKKVTLEDLSTQIEILNSKLDLLLKGATKTCSECRGEGNVSDHVPYSTVWKRKTCPKCNGSGKCAFG